VAHLPREIYTICQNLSLKDFKEEVNGWHDPERCGYLANRARPFPMEDIRYDYEIERFSWPENRGSIAAEQKKNSA